jgi:FdhD protein
MGLKAKNTPFYQFSPGGWEETSSPVITEESVSLTVNGKVWITLMCTPVDVEALAIGFLFNEGVIDSIDEVASVRDCPSGSNVDIWLNHPVEEPRHWRRTSGCGGGATGVETDSLQGRPAASPNPNGFSLSPEKISALISQLYERQALYQQSGGVHTSALSDGEGIVLTAEDVGRHNTLDKLAGHILLDRLVLLQPVVITTGRISSDMLQKAARLGVIAIISRSSPTTLSIRLADNLGVTLIGYARRDSFRVYSHPHRVSSIS